MSIDNLRSALPAYAKDVKLNLGSLTRTTELTEQQLWGSLVAAAAASHSAEVFSEISDEAQEHLSEEAYSAALASATIMAMNNVAYRAKSWLGSDYSTVKFGLRMNVISNPGVEKIDFELWSIAVSVINGCEHCTLAHDKTVRGEGVTKEQVWEVIKVASTVHAVAQAIEIEASR